MTTSALARRAPELVLLLGALVAVETVIAVPLLNISLAVGSVSWLVVSVACVIAIAAVAAFWWCRELIGRTLQAWVGWLARLSPSVWLWGTIAAGTALRLTWVLLLPVEPNSDSATYLRLARALADDQPYYVAHTWSYWPPGYPLYLDLWMRLGLSDAPIIVCSNLLHSALATVVAYHLGRRFTSEGGARLGATILALWPSSVTAAGIAQKEQLLVPLLLGIVYLFLPRAQASVTQRISLWIAAGALLGFCCLVQPSLQLFLGVLVAIAILSRLPWQQLVLSTVVTALAAALVIVPWTLRNLRHFDSFVLISTNGGDNLYRANNPLANGGYAERGERDYGSASETERNALGFRWALQWMGSDAGAFARLALWKQILFLGEDSGGVYETLRRGRGLDGPRYLVPKLAMQGLWWVLWLLICQRMMALWHTRSVNTYDLAVVFVPFAYLWLLHSVFESSGKYHLPVFGFVPIVLAILYGADTGSRASSPTPP